MNAIKTILDFLKPPISIKKWVGISFLLLIFWLIVFTCFYAPTLVRTFFLKDFYLDKLDFEQVSIYVNPQMSTKQRKEIILLYQKSRLRIDSLFGSTESKPTILVGTTDEVMQRFGYPNIEKETKTGMTHLTPFGAYIVLSSEGTNVDVLSHELSHAELMKRLGWKTRRQKIPIWFDEGLAMLVDRRFEYWSALKEDWKKLLNSENTDSVFISQYSTIPFESEEIFALENLQTTEEFFTENAQLHYFLAQQEVSRWYKANGKKGLIQLIEDLEIKSFEESYDK